MSSNLPLDPSLTFQLTSKLLEDSQTSSTPAIVTPSKPLSGPGASRQSRRLQLRNAGFRGATMPSRKVTPNSTPNTMADTSASQDKDKDVLLDGDIENHAPLGSPRLPSGNQGLGGLHVDKSRRASGGILQEIGTEPVIGKHSIGKNGKSRISTSKFVGESAVDPVAPRNDYDAAFTAHETSMSSPPPPSSMKNSIRPKKTKARARIPNKQRRSVSAEASKYIEALEAELASTQSQLSAVNSPSVTRRQKSAMRSRDAETRQLEAEIAEWEERYEERVQEQADRFAEVEAGLRANIRSLEQQAEEGTYKLQELELELETTKESLESAEQANVQMERRLEIMGELLATSPTKIDFATPGPGGVRRNRHQRPRSMMPRFPTAGSLMGSPERVTRTQPTSPDTMFQDRLSASATTTWNGVHPGLSVDTTLPVSDLSSDGGSVFSEAPMTGDSMTTTGTEMLLPLRRESSHYEPHPLLPGARRLTRRMRRFHAGSVGPKPLILPATSHYESVPTSAPPMEEVHGFPFPPPELMQPVYDPISDTLAGHSPMVTRRRSYTEVDETTIASLEAAPFLNVPQTRNPNGEGELEDSSMGPDSAISQATTNNFSSLGSVTGRNLMEELSRARTNRTEDPWSTTGGLSSEIDEANAREEVDTKNLIQTTPYSTTINDHAAPLSRPASSTLLNLASSPSVTSSSPQSNATSQKTAHNRLRLFFANLFRTPLALVRHMIQNAQTLRNTLTIPAPLRTVQWWLVGVLLGPMARRRMSLSRRQIQEDEEENTKTPLLEHTHHRTAVDDNDQASEHDSVLAYGTFATTPSPRSSLLLSQASSSSPDPLHGPVTSVRRGPRSHRRRVSRSRNHKCGCENEREQRQRRRAKHSPWLWVKFSLTLAFAVGAAFAQGPGSLLLCPRGVAGDEEVDGEGEGESVGR